MRATLNDFLLPGKSGRCGATPPYERKVHKGTMINFGKLGLKVTQANLGTMLSNCASFFPQGQVATFGENYFWPNKNAECITYHCIIASE